LIAQDEQEVQKWFKEYHKTLREYSIRRKNIVNFDEAGFRVGCAKGQWILVPEDILEFYSISPENRRSLTIFEAINATGRPPPPAMIVVQGQYLMADWFPKELDPDTYIITLEKGFTTNEIAIHFLNHFIKHLDVGPQVE
jgi:hypothetical protein